MVKSDDEKKPTSSHDCCISIWLVKLSLFYSPAPGSPLFRFCSHLVGGKATSYWNAFTEKKTHTKSCSVLARVKRFFYSPSDLISLSLSCLSLFLSTSSSPAFRFELPGASLLMAGRLRGGATGANAAAAAAAAEAPSTSKSSFFGRDGLNSSTNAARPIADLATAQQDDDEVYDSDSGSESDSESGSAGEEGWRTSSDSKNSDANNDELDGEGYVNSYEPKGFEPDLGIRLIKGDGKCMFRALARGMARNKGLVLSSEDETRDADTLRLAVRDALCRSDARRQLFHEAVTSVEVAEGGLPKYCARLNDAGFWGGEVELMVISRLLHVPIYVYRSSKEAGVEKLVGYGFAPIVKYGEQYAGASEEEGGENRAAGGIGGRKPVNLLYREGNHYDLLVA